MKALAKACADGALLQLKGIFLQYNNQIGDAAA